MALCLRRCSRPGSVSLLPREFASEKTFTSRRANSQPARYRYLRLRVSCVPASLERVTFTLVASVRVAIRIATATRQHKYSRVIVDVYCNNYYFAKLPRNNSSTLSLCWSAVPERDLRTWSSDWRMDLVTVLLLDTLQMLFSTDIIFNILRSLYFFIYIKKFCVNFYF